MAGVTRGLPQEELATAPQRASARRRLSAAGTRLYVCRYHGPRPGLPSEAHPASDSSVTRAGCWRQLLALRSLRRLGGWLVGSLRTGPCSRPGPPTASAVGKVLTKEPRKGTDSVGWPNEGIRAEREVFPDEKRSSPHLSCQH